MINERILEYLILANIEDSICVSDEFEENGKVYSMKKVRERLKELRQEALEPYVVSTNHQSNDILDEALELYVIDSNSRE